MRITKEVYVPSELQLTEDELSTLLGFRIILEHISNEMRTKEVEVACGISLDEITTLYSLTTKVFNMCKIDRGNGNIWQIPEGGCK